jgi:hypothetical protein
VTTTRRHLRVDPVVAPGRPCRSRSTNSSEVDVGGTAANATQGGIESTRGSRPLQRGSAPCRVASDFQPSSAPVGMGTPPAGTDTFATSDRRDCRFGRCSVPCLERSAGRVGFTHRPFGSSRPLPSAASSQNGQPPEPICRPPWDAGLVSRTAFQARTRRQESLPGGWHPATSLSRSAQWHHEPSQGCRSNHAALAHPARPAFPPSPAL